MSLLSPPPQRFQSLVLVPILALLLTSLGQAKQLEVVSKTALPPANSSAETDTPETWRYLLHLPKDYEQSRETWPLLIFLHGRSIRGDNLQQVKRYGPPSFLDRRPAFPFVVVSPQLPDGSWPASSLLKLLDEIEATYRIDPNRIYLTGVSLGGGGAWYLAAADASRFAAFAPVCGYSGLSTAKHLTELPIWGFHGSADELTPLSQHQKLVEAVNAKGGNAKLTVIPGGSHGSIIVPVYKQEELYDWFLANERGKRGAQPPRERPALIASVMERFNRQKPESENPPPAPPAETVNPITTTTMSYTVKPGDTLWKLGNDHQTSVEAIKAANSLTSNVIYVDQVLKIPSNQ